MSKTKLTKPLLAKFNVMTTKTTVPPPTSITFMILDNSFLAILNNRRTVLILHFKTRMTHRDTDNKAIKEQQIK